EDVDMVAIAALPRSGHGQSVHEIPLDVKIAQLLVSRYQDTRRQGGDPPRTRHIRTSYGLSLRSAWHGYALTRSGIDLRGGRFGNHRDVLPRSFASAGGPGR